MCSGDKCGGLGIYGSGGMDVVFVVAALAVEVLAVEAAGGMEAIARQ